jgi:hypothetical protein
MNSEGWKLHDKPLALYPHRRANTDRAKMLNLQKVIS